MCCHVEPEPIDFPKEIKIALDAKDHVIRQLRANERVLREDLNRIVHELVVAEKHLAQYERPDKKGKVVQFISSLSRRQALELLDFLDNDINIREALRAYIASRS